MITPDGWRKSSYSGSGDGNACVEISHRHPRIAVRDSKAPARAALSFPRAPSPRSSQASKLKSGSAESWLCSKVSGGRSRPTPAAAKATHA
ncbi:DUF397 domain-containing protein [Streptomyces sp. SW4]|nr:DUF397 domain-containing protein [Streptomyces sp. SW4]